MRCPGRPPASCGRCWTPRSGCARPARRIAGTHQRSGGTRSAAEELARRGGTPTGQAKKALDTSHRLPDQPAVDKALRRGERSPAQAALISAAAAADPSQAGRLSDFAGRVSLPELRDECARVRAAADPDPDATIRRIHAHRRLRHYTAPKAAGTCPPAAPPMPEPPS
jgi:hypothetical protein